MHSSPLMTRQDIPSGLSTSVHTNKFLEDDYERDHLESLFPVSEMYTHVQEFLSQPDHTRDAYSSHPEFLYQLGLMLEEIESHRSLRRKAATLREEFSRVQNENVQLRTYLNSRLPAREPVVSSPSTFSPIPRPSADVSGKTWDSIVLDLI
ncbi:hypothetical protein N7532_012080 [Penicillium argentinense]|uniref:Uncharacterized protein n=1 Tax=Penicillium argentinense TaxID=1131581 RepID=A0A9W9EJN1_9EURO|nr:uncharacterized protein N7532_012080 [Penicillium argentinense]KAJ5083037.1 hypothetical protein N7532_012080 [Penicillium argentinense]